MKLSKLLLDSQHSFSDVQAMADKFNKYGLAAKNINGKFYSYRNGKQTGVFDTMDLLKGHQEELIANESTIKPYVSMYNDKDTGKMTYDVLDKDSKSAFKSTDKDKAMKWFSDNFDRLKEAGGYEGQAEPTSHVFKDADIKKIADIIKQKDIKAYPEQTDDGVKVHTFNQDRESVATELEIEESAPAVIGAVARALTSPGLKGTLSRSALSKTVNSITSEDQPEPSLNDLVKQDAESNDEDEDVDQLPAFLKKPKSQENELNRMRKLAGMSTAGGVTEYDGPDETIDGSFSDRQIKQAFGILNDPRFKQGNYDGAVEVINKISPGLSDHPSVQNALKRANEATNDLVKTITPIKGVVGTNASPQMTAKGIDAISQGERPSPQQVKAVSPYMSKIAQAMQDPKTKTQMRNIIKKVQ